MNQENKLEEIYDECGCSDGLVVLFEVFSQALVQLGELWVQEKKPMIEFNQIMPRYMGRQMKRDGFK